MTELESNQIIRNSDGSIDYRAYDKRARRARSQLAHSLLQRLHKKLSCFAGWISRLLKPAFPKAHANADRRI